MRLARAIGLYRRLVMPSGLSKGHRTDLGVIRLFFDLRSAFLQRSPRLCMLRDELLKSRLLFGQESFILLPPNRLEPMDVETR